MVAYWIHNGREWVCVGTRRPYAAYMVRVARSMGYDPLLAHRGKVAITRATAAGALGQENIPAPLAARDETTKG